MTQELETVDFKKPPLRLVAATIAAVIVAGIALGGMATGNLTDLTPVWAAILSIFGYAVARDIQTS